MVTDNMQNPKLSVIIPIYKVEAYLPRCIDSIINQSYKNLEVILVDDGSPDDCGKICDRYAEKYDYVQVIHKTNGGLISARKAGLNSASGDYICYVDGDDWVSPDHFIKVAEAISQDDPNIVIHGYTVAKETLEEPMPQIYLDYKYYTQEALEQEVIPCFLSREPFYTPTVVPSVWGKSFRRDLLLKMQMDVPDEITIGEDAAVSYPAILEAASVSIIDDCGYMYRLNTSSMTRTYDRKLTTNLPILADYLESKFRESPYYEVVKPQFCKYISFMTLGAISNELRGTESVKETIEKLQPLIQNEVIRESVKAEGVPSKIRKTFQYIETKQRLPLFIMKKYWSMRRG